MLFLILARDTVPSKVLDEAIQLWPKSSDDGIGMGMLLINNCQLLRTNSGFGACTLKKKRHATAMTISATACYKASLSFELWPFHQG